MLRIKINDDLIKFANNFSDNLFILKGSRFVMPTDGLKALTKKFTNEEESRILSIIIWFYKRILKLTPEKQQKWANVIDKNYSEIFYKKHTGETKEKATDFSNAIVAALRYDELRSSETSKIIEEIKIKTCVYCNSQLAVVVEQIDGTKKARFELDHYFPKSRYPLFCTSFFNLIPSCSNCNKGKSAKPVNINRNFHLYIEEDLALTPFEFKLEDTCIAEYLSKKDKNVLKLEFIDISAEAVANTHNEDFAIVPIYNTQMDIVQELLWRHECYTKAKKKDLRRFGITFNNDEMRSKMLIGNYTKPSEVHKRPLAKFTQDIARQLKLIK